MNIIKRKRKPTCYCAVDEALSWLRTQKDWKGRYSPMADELAEIIMRFRNADRYLTPIGTAKLAMKVWRKNAKGK